MGWGGRRVLGSCLSLAGRGFERGGLGCVLRMAGREGGTRNIPLRLVCFEFFLFFWCSCVCDGLGWHSHVVVGIISIGIINIFMVRVVWSGLGLAGRYIYIMYPMSICFVFHGVRI